MPTSSKTRQEVKNGWGTTDSGPIDPYNTIFSANIRALIDNAKWIDEGIDNIQVNATKDVWTITFGNGSTQTISLPKYVTNVDITDGVLTFTDVDGNVLGKSPKFATYAQLQNETTERQSADTNLQTALTAETTARQNADTQLRTYIDDEIIEEAEARESADDILQGNITAEENARKAADKVQKDYTDAEIATEKTSRQSADDQLQAQITAESQARANADNTLQTNIDTERDTRIAQDTAIRNDLAQEVSDREAADDVLQANILAEENEREINENAIRQSINDEKIARQNGDTALQTGLDNETAARESADTNLQSEIDDETNNRLSSDSSLQAQIDTLNNSTKSIKFPFDSTDHFDLAFGDITFQAYPNGSATSGSPTWHVLARNMSGSSLDIGYTSVIQYSGSVSNLRSYFGTINHLGTAPALDGDSMGIGQGTTGTMCKLESTVTASNGSVYEVLATCPTFATSGSKTVIFSVTKKN